ncbi:MAG: M24 family metallopeptidase [Planctomycetaceae bacterium]|nr:M24 family metallopeptidase [Planctomycetaceae bacterium]
MFSLEKIQNALKQFGIDVWLLYDFRGSNVLARRILHLPDDQMGSRRCCYAIPAEGQPIKLVHRIERGAFDHLPGRKIVYLTWQELESGFEELVSGHKTVAMEYSPRNANPYISKVDAGTIELIRSFGVEVVESGNLIQLFEAVWSDQQWQQHLAAGKLCDEAFNVAWKFIADGVRHDGSVDESAVCDAIMDHFTAHNLTTYHPPIVAVGPHSSDCHYETGTGENTSIKEGDFVLVDLWAKLDEPGSVYADMTRTGFVGEAVPEKYTEIFNIVAAARDAAISYAEEAFANHRPLQGWEIDQACRQVIEEAGYGKYFVHRTGHNIGQEVHGNGAHMDNLETREERLVLPMTCFSVEPGIYQEGKFGVRSEVDVFVDADQQVHVTYGERQTEIVPILKNY